MSDDEYAAYNLDDFTEDDFKDADAAVARIASAARAEPQITIQVGSPTSGPSRVSQPEGDASRSLSEAAGKRQMSPWSPFKQYRHGTFSVTDLTALAWCELQFDYGLRQRRHKPLERRPASFVTAHGKEIFVKKAVAKNRDQVTKKGKAIHKELEREIRPEELPVAITSEEERWALRLVNMLASLRSVILEGYTREMPVFGILQNEVVVGIIDEVSRQPQVQPKRPPPSTPSNSKSKKPRRSDSPSQHLISEYLEIPPIEDAAACKDKLPESVMATPPPLDEVPIPIAPLAVQNVLHLIDTKTRQRNCLPDHKDTITSRMQLMLYHRLLTDMISTTHPFDFAFFWKRLRVNPSVPLSTTFLVQAGLLVENSEWPSSCLNDLTKAWVAMVQALDVSGVDTTLELVYRLQPQGPNQAGQKIYKQRKNNLALAMSREDLDLARAIEASLSDMPPTGQTKGPTVIRNSEVEPQPDTIPDSGTPKPPASECAVANGSVLNGHSTSSDEPTSGSESDIEIHNFSIIGVKKFLHDKETLDDHLTRALQWWHGKREPDGVSIEDSRRCRTCEYESGCEWREAKALEVQERLQGQQ